MMETLLKKSRLDQYIEGLGDDVLNGDFDVIFKNAPISRDAQCGIGSLRGRFLQK